MPDRMCCEPNCESKVQCRGLCSKHYRAFLQATIREACAVADCELVRSVGCRGWCTMHYTRWQKNGDPGTASASKKPRGSGHVHATGYMLVTIHGHPLANKQTGRVPAHRAALYDAIGPGSHPCHWCGIVLPWTSGSQETLGLTADHLDWDRLNNEPANLVPSCISCNSQRHEHPLAVGAAHPAAKLTELQVSEIRTATGATHRALAQRYGVSESLIWTILHRKAWKTLA